MDVHSKHGSHLPDGGAEEPSQEPSQKQAGAEEPSQEPSQKQGGAEEPSQKQAGAEEPSQEPSQKMVVSEEDPDLEELLDLSLNEFGCHIPVQVKPSQLPEGNTEAATPEGTVEEFEGKLTEAMKMLAADSPELWQQFEAISKTMGLDEDPAPQSSSQTGDMSLDSKLEETLTKLRQSTEQIQMGGTAGSSLLDGLDLGSEDEGDSLMKVMGEMMNTLLSKDVLYPSLSDLCRQYPDWLSSHRDVLSKEDYTRYSKQMDVMKAICQEFESETDDDNEESQANQRILQLMQQLQEYGQPPEDLTGEMVGLPAGMVNIPDPKNCLVM